MSRKAPSSWLIHAGIAACICATQASAATLSFTNDTAHAVLARSLGVLIKQVVATGKYSGSDVNRMQVRVVLKKHLAEPYLDWNASLGVEYSDSLIADWTQATMSGGTFTATFNVGEGGWYAFQARALNSGGTPVDTIESIFWRIRTFFDNYQIIQRNKSTQSAQVTISGNCSQATAASVRARVVRHGTTTAIVDWTTISTSLAGGNFSGSLTVPQGGWYNLQIEALNSGGTAVASENCTQKWGVGMVILCIGQSNMAGSAPVELPYVIANDLGGLYSNNGNWEHLRDPYDYGGVVGQIDKQWWGDIGLHSITPALVNALVAQYQIPVGVVPTAVGGRGLVGDSAHYWGYRNPSKHLDTLTLYGNSVRKAQRSGGVELIAMWQGETDADNKISQSAYQARLQSLVSWYRQDLLAGIPLFMLQIGGSRASPNIDPYVTNIRTAQALSDNGTDLFMGAVAADLTMAPNNNWHYTKAAYNLIGTRLANAIAYSLGNATYYRGPTVASAQFSPGSRKEIIVTIAHRAGTDISPASGIVGFDVSDNGIYAPIQSAVRLSANTIKLTLHNPAAGACAIRYKYGRAGSGENAVHDNTPLQLPLEPTTAGIPVSDAPTITLISPNGGETWSAGIQHTISWSSTGQFTNVKIDYSTDGGTSWQAVSASAPNTGSLIWVVPTTVSSQYKIHVAKSDDAAVAGASNTVFSVVSPAGTSSQIALSAATINENLAAGAAVGAFSLVAGGAATFSLVAGTGGDNNAQFAIQGTSLTTAAAFDFETKDSYSIRVHSSTGIDEIFIIRVNNATDAPSIVSTVPAPGTITCTIDTVINIDVTLADQDRPISSLVKSWTLDGQPAAMPMVMAKDGQHTLVLMVTDNQTAPLTRTWTIVVNKRILAAGVPTAVTIPPNGIVHVEDGQNTKLAVRFTAGDYAYNTVRLTFLSRSAIPASTYWPKQPKWYYYLDAVQVVDSVGIARFKVEPNVPNLFNAMLSVTNSSINIHHFVTFLDTNWKSSDTGPGTKRYFWTQMATAIDTGTKTVSSEISYFGSWTKYQTFAVLRFAATDSAKITGIRPVQRIGCLDPDQVEFRVISSPLGSMAHMRIGIPERYDQAPMSLRALNLRGQVVWSLTRQHQKAGWFTQRIDVSPAGQTTGAGIYICQLRVGTAVLVRKLLMRR